MTEAYERALLDLKLTDRTDPITELIARKIFDVAQTGVRDPAEIAAAVTREFGRIPSGDE